MATLAAVQGAGLIIAVWKKLERAIYDAGGTDEHVARLAKDETDTAFANFGVEIVRTIKVMFASFRDMIRAGRYDFLWGFAEKPEEIRGQVFHPVDGETDLDHPSEVLTTQQVYDRYGERMADLSELLDYGICNPKVQRQFPIGIVWKDETGQFWYAILDGDGSHRRLGIHQDHLDVRWRDYDRFLVRKSR